MSRQPRLKESPADPGDEPAPSRLELNPYLHPKHCKLTPLALKARIANQSPRASAAEAPLRLHAL